MINRILKTEMVGEDVKLLQTNLTSLGIYTKGISGHFDTYTKNCVIKYQMSNGLDPNGIITVPVWYSILTSLEVMEEVDIKDEPITEDDNVSEEVEPVESKKSRKKHE